MADIKKIMELSGEDISKMSRAELAKITTILISAANKRIKRLENTPSGTLSPAYQKAMERGKFSVKGKTLNQIRNEFKAVKSYLSTQTSTVSGWKTVRKRVSERIGGKFKNDEQEIEFWKTYRKLEQQDPAGARAYGSTNLQRDLYKTMNDSADPLSDMIQKINENYEKKESESINGDFYEFDGNDFDPDKDL